jgi:integrase/recombinase XerD
MKEEKTTPLRQRMIDDMRIRDIKETTQKGHIRAVKNFAAFLGRSSDTATPDELRAYQLHMTDTGVSTATFNTRIVSLRLFFGTTCGREEMKRYMQFRRKLDLSRFGAAPLIAYYATKEMNYGTNTDR